jgi:membrane-associated phospholipid phosphatase
VIRERKERAVELSTGGLALALFIWLATAVLRKQTLWFDIAIRQTVHSYGSPLLTHLMRYITISGDIRFLIPLLLVVEFWLVHLKRYRTGLKLLIVWPGATAISESLKLIFRRARPEAFFGYSEPITYSFPSGHTIASTCCFCALAALLTARIESLVWKIVIWTVAALISLAVGFSRIYLGVHYPSDVLAGYAISVVWVTGLRAIYQI